MMQKKLIQQQLKQKFDDQDIERTYFGIEEQALNVNNSVEIQRVKEKIRRTEMSIQAEKDSPQN